MTEQDNATPVTADAAAPAAGMSRLVGRVISEKMMKTITVLVERRVKHPVYGKYVRRSTKVHAHDENGDGHVGDTVAIVQCRPMSKTKAWRLDEVIERAK